MIDTCRARNIWKDYEKDWKGDEVKTLPLLLKFENDITPQNTAVQLGVILAQFLLIEEGVRKNPQY